VGAKRVELPPKLARPRLYSPVTRERLHRLLDESRAHPVVWIVAPPGAGKTTLAAAYLAARELKSVWYQLDAGDADPAAFLQDLELARSAIAPKPKGSLPAFTAAHLRNLPGFARGWFRVLYKGLSVPFVFVFDNYHEVPETSAIHALLSEGFKEIPQGGTVLVLSRAEPPKEFTSALAAQTLAVVDAVNLKFTLEEARSLVDTAGLALAPDVVAQLHTSVEGWAAGLVLLIEHARRVGLDLEKARSRSMEGLFHYFGREALASLPEEIQHFLLTTAFLPRITAEAAEAVSGNREAGSILQTLSRRQLFTDRRETPRTTYQYHALFREFLLDLGRRTFSDDELTRLQIRAAELMESDGAADAIELYLAAKDYARAVRLILREAPRLLSQGRRLTLAQWIARVPEPLKAQSGWLLHWSAAETLDPRAIRQMLQRAHARFVESRDVTGRASSASWTLITYFAMERGNVAPMDPWIAELEQLLAEDCERVAPDVQYMVLLTLVSALVSRRPDAPLLVEYAARLTTMVEHLPAHLDAISGSVALIIYCRWMGDADKAERLARLVETFFSRPADVHAKVYWLIHYTALRCHLFAEFGAPAQARLDRALSLLAEEGIHYLSPIVEVVRLEVLLSSGELDLAQAMVQDLAARLDPRAGYERSCFHALRAYLALRRDEPRAALEQAVTALAAANANGLVQWRVYALIVAAIAHAQVGALAQARDCIGQARRGMAGPFFRFNAALVEAYIALHAGDCAEANRLLEDALSVGRDHGYCNTWFWLPEMMAELCAYAVRQGTQVNCAKRLIRQRGLVPPDLRADDWPWPIRIYTLGRFSLVIDDETLTAQGKTQRKPVELLKAVLAHGGRGVDQGQLAALLWPDLEGDAARNGFDLALHRLRKLLKSEDALSMHDGKVSLDRARVWVDAWAFEHACAGAENAKTLASEAESSALVRRLLDYYSGHFLAGEDAPWVLSMRERLRNKLMRTLSVLGERLESEARWEEAILLYRRAIEVDPLAEEFYRRLMLAFRAQGRIAEGLDAYRRCRDLISITLGVAPSSQTEAAYRLLKQG
jgi:LuxR family maltose regulon positive regulatory protein